MVYGSNEILRVDIKHFSKAILENFGLDDGTAREALKKGQKHMSVFKNKICSKYPPTIQNTFHRAKGFIDLEEKNEHVKRELPIIRE